MNMSDWGVWFGSVATFLAVLVALFKEEMMRFWRKPILNVSIKMAPPDCHDGWTIYQDQRTGALTKGIVYYLRLWVSNDGNLPATNVQVFASKLFREADTGQFKNIDSFLPLNLKWAHTEEIFKDRIIPKMGRHCDLGHIADPKLKLTHNETKSDIPEDKTALFLSLEVIPITPFHLLETGNYLLELLVAADNANPTRKIVEIKHSGEWFENAEDMFSKGIELKLNSYCRN